MDIDYIVWLLTELILTLIGGYHWCDNNYLHEMDQL